jgi:hypothetical protein
VPPARVAPRETSREIVRDVVPDENAKRAPEEIKVQREAERKARQDQRRAERKRHQRYAERRIAEERRAREEERHAREEEEVAIEHRRASTERPRPRIIEADDDPNVGRVVVRQEPMEERGGSNFLGLNFGGR